MDEMLREAVARETRRKRISNTVAYSAAVLLVLPVGWVLATLRGLEGQPRRVAMVVVSASLVLLAFVIIRAVQWASGRAVVAIMNPGGSGHEPVGHSNAQALAAAGRFDEASEAFEAARGSDGDDVSSLRAEAEIHAAVGGDPVRAAELLQRIRRVPGASPTDELYATHRLIDLYLGALNDPGKVMTELRRMADRFPNTIDGQSALAELRRRREAEKSSSGEVA